MRIRALVLGGLIVVVMAGLLLGRLPRSEMIFRVPMEGPVYVINGGSTEDVNYHVRYPDQRWAYDLGVVNGIVHRGRGLSLQDYYSYGQPVYSPASGRVVSAHDGEPDQGVNQGRFARIMAGNHVVIRIARSRYLFMGHFKPGSVRVREGDQVQAGQLLAAIENSGRSRFPHLHVHLQNTPFISFGLGVPLRFDYVIDGVRKQGIPRAARPSPPRLRTNEPLCGVRGPRISPGCRPRSRRRA